MPLNLRELLTTFTVKEFTFEHTVAASSSIQDTQELLITS